MMNASHPKVDSTTLTADSGGVDARSTVATASPPTAHTLGIELLDEWEKFRSDGDRQARDKLILHHVPMVKAVVSRLASRFPANVDHNDLVSSGTTGFLQAIDSFDPARGVPFPHYAASRIRGAVLDHLRSMDWATRQVRRRASEIQTATVTLEAKLNRSPEHSEIAEFLGWTEQALTKALMEINDSGILALDAPHGSSTVVDTLLDAGQGPGWRLEAAERMEELRNALAKISERERHVIAMYYGDGLTMSQIGGVLGVTESRVSQIHAKTLLQLRALMSAADAN